MASPLLVGRSVGRRIIRRLIDGRRDAPEGGPATSSSLRVHDALHFVIDKRLSGDHFLGKSFFFCFYRSDDGGGGVVVDDALRDVDAVVVELVQAAAEVVPQAEEDLAEVAQAADEQAVVDVELVEPARQSQSARYPPKKKTKE